MLDQNRQPSVALVQTALPEYRQVVLEAMADDLGRDFKVYTGAEHFQSTARTVIEIPGHVSVVDNAYLLGRRLLWQRLPFRQVIGADVVMAEINPRVLSTWAVILARKVRRRPTVLWGHAWPLAGRSARSDILRHAQRRTADLLVTYTETQRVELAERMGDLPIVAAPNAMFRADDMRPAEVSSIPTDLVYVGRLVERKKPRLMVQAFLRAMPTLPSDVNLTIVGEGPERAELERLVSEVDAERRVSFLGHIADVGELRAIYARAIASVSPGYVGLSLTQSLGFGVPMVISTDEDHAPEIEAALEGENCVFVSSNDEDALAAAFLSVVADRRTWVDRRFAIAAWTAERYTAEAMASRLVHAVRLAHRG